MSFLHDNQIKIKKILLSVILILIMIVMINFLYHEFFFSKLENVKDYTLNKTFISYNQDYVSTLVDLKHYDSFKLVLSLNEKLNEDDITLEYSLDDGKKWIKTNLKEVFIDKTLLNDINYILVSIRNNTLNEENDFKLEIPESKIPTVLVSYSTTEPTKESVVATIMSLEEDITVINNDGLNTYTFKENGEFTFEYKDSNGTIYSKTCKVDWIIDTVSNVEIFYDITNFTNMPVTATIKSDEPIKILNNDGKLSHTFYDNGEFIFEYLDSNGNKKTLSSSVNWIDKIPPKAKITYDIINQTTEEVTAILTNENENIIIMNNDGLDYYTFKENGKFTFIFQDEAGNTSNLTASVSWISKVEEELPNVTPSSDEGKQNDIYLSKDATSKKTTYKSNTSLVSVPTYKVNEPLTLREESVQIDKNIEEYVGNKSQAVNLALIRTNKTIKNIDTALHIAFELDPDKKFLGIYRLNSDTDLEELYYKKVDKNHIELDVQNLGNYIISYSKKELKPIKVPRTTSDFLVIVLFIASLSLITGGILAFRKSRR